MEAALAPPTTNTEDAKKEFETEIPNAAEVFR
jgi:hypothetical protein